MSAAESLGIRDLHKIFKHIMPNVIPIIIVTATLAIGDTIIMESTMSYLGVGVLPPMSSWGQMVSAGTNLMTFKLRVDAGRILYLIDSTCGEPCR